MPSILRRFSSAVRGKDRDGQDKPSKRKSMPNGSSATNGKPKADGWPLTNGVADGASDDSHADAAKFSMSEAVAASGYPDPPDHGDSRVDIGKALDSLGNMVSHSMRPMPEKLGDGSYDKEDPHPSLFKELKSIGVHDIKTLKDQIEAGKGPIDDKTMLMERVIQLVADLPDKSLHRAQLTNTFVDQLYNSLQHPPLSYLGDEFRYRRADGSGNNIMYPDIGKANTPYARTVQPETIQPGALPDPSLIFDSVFARETFRPHPNKNSSVIFYWASIIIHDLFQTDHHDFSKSQTSSYLDLSPLYGDVQEDQNQMRTFKDGKLKPDCFAEHRLLTFPPGCGVILLMFNRFHNYVAENLAIINQGGRFAKPKDDLPKDMAEKAWAKYDNDLFQTARLVTSGLYMNITLIDYVRTIINLNRSNSTWTLDPRVKENDTCFNEDGTPRGMGNQVSAEFALVYRWHSAISEKDDRWTQALFKKMWGKPADEVSMPELLGGLAKWEAEMSEDPFERDFHGLMRGENGNFSDDELVDLICDSIEDVAGAFGANHIPKVMKSIEILGMRQARAWDVASLNEFRKFFGLKAHKSFEDVNDNPYVAEQLKYLYEHPDNIELYTGLIAEKSKEPMTKEEGGPVGVGISPTYTISRAILSDAVALVRGDRFYTIDYTPRNLTNWGYSEVAYNFDVEQGCSFYKLFIRAFPQHFKPNSIYAHMPMTVPEENRKIMKDLGRESHYSYDRPKRMQSRVTIQNYRGVRQVLEDQMRFKVTWGDATEYVYGKGGRNFMLSGDTPFYAKQRSEMKQSLYKDQWHQHVKDFYTHITMKLVQEKAVKIANVHQIDFTRDIGNLAHTHFAANVFSLPLKTDEHPRGIYSEHELYMVLALIFVFIFFDVDPGKTFPLALGAHEVTQQLGKLIETNVKFVSKTGWLSGITDKLHQQHGPLADYGVHMVRKLLSFGMSVEDAAWSQIFPTATAMVANQAQVITQIMDFYLAAGGQKYWPDIVRLAKQNDDTADEKILRYAMEAIRLHGTFGTYRSAAGTTTVDDSGFSGQKEVKPGDKVFVSFVKANRDPTTFPDPMEVKLDRPLEKYIHYGLGPHQCLGKDASQIALTAMVKVMARLENLRPASGPQGILKKVPREDGFYAYMTEDEGKYFPFPTTWKLHFDGEPPKPTAY